MITTVSSIPSTNSALAARLQAGEAVPEGDWLIADRQSAGIGRQGRAWQDGIGNFMGSTVVRPLAHDPPAATLALVAGLAVQAAIAPHLPPAHPAMLKWPNDVLVAGVFPSEVESLHGLGNTTNKESKSLIRNSQKSEFRGGTGPLPRPTTQDIVNYGWSGGGEGRCRTIRNDSFGSESKAKLAGILLERVGDAVVVGIGVNLAHAPVLADRPTVAVADYGPAPDRNHFAETLAALFAEDLHRWRSYGLAPIISRWQTVAHPPGTSLTITDSGAVGTFVGLGDDGALHLRLPDGTVQIIHSGEVALA